MYSTFNIDSKLYIHGDVIIRLVHTNKVIPEVIRTAECYTNLTQTKLFFL